MRKIFVLSLLFVSIFIMASCSNSTDLVDEAADGDTTAETASNEYYLLIDEDYDTYENGQYIYSLEGYNETGEQKKITFYTTETLELESIVKVQVEGEGDEATSDPVTVDIDNVPEKAQEKLSEN